FISLHSILARPPRPPLFPYPTLFRSRRTDRNDPIGALSDGDALPLEVGDGDRKGRRRQGGRGGARGEGRVRRAGASAGDGEENRSEEHTSELQSRFDLVCRLLLEKKN